MGINSADHLLTSSRKYSPYDIIFLFMLKQCLNIDSISTGNEVALFISLPDF